MDDAEAVVVRRIFREFARANRRAIATNLSRDGIPGPFGRTWGDTTIRGHACRSNGVVNNGGRQAGLRGISSHSHQSKPTLHRPKEMPDIFFGSTMKALIPSAPGASLVRAVTTM